MHQKFVETVNNGVGSFLSRVMIIIGFPIISGLAVFAFNQWSEKLDYKLHIINDNVIEQKATIKELDGRLRVVEGQMGLVQERLGSQDARLTQLEKKR